MTTTQENNTTEAVQNVKIDVLHTRINGLDTDLEKLKEFHSESTVMLNNIVKNLDTINRALDNGIKEKITKLSIQFESQPKACQEMFKNMTNDIIRNNLKTFILLLGGLLTLATIVNKLI